jgi:hypothetical protein
MRTILAKLLLILTITGMMAWVVGCESEGRRDRDDYYGDRGDYDRGHDHGGDRGGDRDRDMDYR